MLTYLASDVLLPSVAWLRCLVSDALISAKLLEQTSGVRVFRIKCQRAAQVGGGRLQGTVDQLRPAQHLVGVRRLRLDGEPKIDQWHDGLGAPQLDRAPARREKAILAEIIGLGVRCLQAPIRVDRRFQARRRRVEPSVTLAGGFGAGGSSPNTISNTPSATVQTAGL